MHETYRMLGQEHELDLSRVAKNGGGANLVGTPAQSEVAAERTRERWSRFMLEPLLTQAGG